MPFEPLHQDAFPSEAVADLPDGELKRLEEVDGEQVAADAGRRVPLALAEAGASDDEVTRPRHEVYDDVIRHPVEGRRRRRRRRRRLAWGITTNKRKTVESRHRKLEFGAVETTEIGDGAGGKRAGTTDALE